MTDFASAGLGLQYGTVRLVHAREGWAVIASELAAEINRVLSALVVGIEHVGSTAVPGLLAKPIIDLAVGIRPGAVLSEVTEAMSRLGWIYRGDAGDAGGWIFVFEDSPWHRVAHAHGVEFGGSQWVQYLRFRDLLLRSPVARRTYEEAKQHLAEQHPDGRQHYTAGKDPTVLRLLAAEA